MRSLSTKFFILIVAATIQFPRAAIAQSAEEIAARFQGRSGGYSEDHRVDEHDLATILGPGPKTGCHGDTLEASVTVNSSKATVSGNVTTITVTYNGKYTRQGWIKPCIQSPPPNGREDKDVSGKITMTVKQPPLKNLEIAFDGPTDVGGDVNHDSNRTAAEAAKRALLSGL